jgi:tRNA threonylcarbamoyl adenosine modification protein YeaZ
VVLLLDSSGNYLVAGLADPQHGVVAETAHPTGTASSRDLSAVVNALLESAGSEVLDGVITGTGPGTFIGTRMAVSFANGLAAATGCELRGISSLATIAAVHPDPVAVVRDARRGQAYLYLSGSTDPQTELVTLDQLAPRITSAAVQCIVLEGARCDDAKGAARVSEIAGLLRPIAEVTPVETVPVGGIWKAGQGASAQAYVEPEYYRGFL